MTVSVADPAAVATRWGEVLGLDAATGRIELADGGRLAFAARDDGVPVDGITAVQVALPAGVRAGRATETICGVRFELTDAAGG